MNTRRDLAYATSLISSYMSDPLENHFKATKRILKYVKATFDYGIQYYKNNNDVTLIGYSDSNWGRNINDKNSISSNCFNLGLDLVTWSSRKQSAISLSSTKVEYVAITSVNAQYLWLRKVIEELGEK